MKRNKKQIILIVSLIGLFLVFLYIFYKPVNYSKKYQIAEYNIVEMYFKNEQYYQFTISFNNIKIPYLIINKYNHKRKLINDIKTFKSENELCILPISEYLVFYPLCTNYESIYTFNQTEIKDIPFKYENINIIDNEFKGIKINYLNNKSYLLFNYKGFNLINNKDEDYIELFNKDVYNLDLVYQKDNYLIIPDYNSNYYFNKVFIINILNGKVKTINTDNYIYFDGYFLGDYKNIVYYVDRKEEKEYKIDLKKNIIEKIDYVMIKDNKLIKCDYNDLKIVDKSYIYNYVIEDNILYLNIDGIRIRITNKENIKIIKIEDDTVYYLSEDNLYMYNNKYGGVLLLSNFEWNFNKINMIYFY